MMTICHSEHKHTKQLLSIKTVKAPSNYADISINQAFSMNQSFRKQNIRK